MKKKTLIFSNEFINTINDMCSIYKENFEILYKYFLSLYPEYHYHTFDLWKNEKIILIQDDCTATWFYKEKIKRKEIIILKKEKIETMIYECQDLSIQDAYKNLQEVCGLPACFHFKNKKKKQYVSCFVDSIKNKLAEVLISTGEGEYRASSILQKNALEIKDDDLLLKNLQNDSLYIENYDGFEKVVRFVSFYNFHHRKDLLFDKNGRLYEDLRGVSLENYDLKKVDWNHKNISGIDITHNPEVRINFNKIIKDLSDANISGYDLNKYKFIGWNLSDTNLRDTSAVIDLATCMITLEGKMNSGTLFDENNTFVFEQNELSHEDVRNLGIKIYKKEKKDEKR